MYQLRIRNEYGDEIELTNNEAYVITDITGLEPVVATINETKNASSDGTVFNSASLAHRQIIITMAINTPCEPNRIRLFKYLNTKRPVRVFFKNDTRDVYTDGYIQQMPITYFDKKQIVQVTIICPNPYFNTEDDATTDFSTVVPNFEFPMNIETPIPFSTIEFESESVITNVGDVEDGAIFELMASGAVSNPKIYDLTTNEYFSLTIDMVASDKIIINTRDKEKSVKLVRAGVTTNIIGRVDAGVSWLKLRPGDNQIAIDADSGAISLRCAVTVVNMFGGV